MDPALSAVLKRPFAQQLAFLRQRLARLLPTRSWDDLWKSRHDRAFMVAGAMKADLLADLAAAVERSIAEGTSIGEFRKAFRKIVERTGWVHTGSHNWRTRVIYRTNAATSYAAGRLQQLREGEFAYWMYKHGGSADPRPQHLAWDGLVLPADHPFWQTHSPPNGWGCSCRVVGLRKREDGLRLGGDPSKQLADGWDRIDAKTGEPVGIDRGWGYQPGATAGYPAQIAAKVASLPRPLAQQLQASVQTGPHAAAPVLKTVDDFVSHGRGIVDKLPDPTSDPRAFVQALVAQLRREVGTETPVKIASGGSAAALVAQASRLFPDSWTAAADGLGELFTKAVKGRAGQYTNTRFTSPFRLKDWGLIPNPKVGQGWITARDIGSAVHELAHRIQSALPKLDALFQDLHKRRTAGDKLRRLRDLTGNRRYGSEVTREDHYINPYIGKEYNEGGALEVMTVAFEYLLSIHDSATRDRIEAFRLLYTKDRELFDLSVGLLFGWRP